MTDTDETEKNLGEQLADLVRRKPQRYDVTFSVGSEKIKVKAVKIILEAASPVFEREFEDKWESAVMKEGDGIPLPDVNPDAFKLLVKLIISDTWSVEALNNLDLKPSDLLNLLELCRRFKITKGIKNLGAAAEEFIQNFTVFKDTNEFLEISQDNLETIISHERIPLDEKEIFESGCRWAENQCQQKKIEPTGENLRQVLGSCFFEIRFPTMKFDTFSKVSIPKKNMFSLEERLEIYDFISMDDKEKARYDKSQLPFKTYPRIPFGCSVLCLPRHYKIIEEPSFVCNGVLQNFRFQVSEKVQLIGVGFLGPIQNETQFDVTVQLRHYKHYKLFESGTLEKGVFARKGKIFYFLFDEPITMEPNSFGIDWDFNSYYIDYTLKGANNVSQYKVENQKVESVQISGVNFHVDSQWNDGKPLAELLFKKN